MAVESSRSQVARRTNSKQEKVTVARAKSVVNVALLATHLFYRSVKDIGCGLFVHMQVPFIHRHNSNDWPGFASIGTTRLDNFHGLPEIVMLHVFLKLLE